MIIDGKTIAHQIQNEIQAEINQLKGRKPCLAVLLVGNNPASVIYVQRKAEACEKVGIISIRKHLPSETKESELLLQLNEFNRNPDVDGILVQLPLPPHINPLRIIENIAPDKDVDGLHPLNAGKLLIGDFTGFVPCTPLGVKVLLERSHIDIKGKHVVILGRSNLVGKPLATLLMQNIPGGNATVTVVHSMSSHAPEICRTADILIAAIGKAHHVKADMVKENAVVIDVGINKLVDTTNPKGFRLVGDVDFDRVKEKCSHITPVPGGVGPMTIAMLLNNTCVAFKRAQTNKK